MGKKINMKANKQPKYLILYLYGEDVKFINTTQRFVEHTNKRAWMWDVERLKKKQIKYTNKIRRIL